MSRKFKPRPRVGQGPSPGEGEIETYAPIGRNLREARHAKDWSMADVHEASGVCKDRLSAYEHGKSMPTLSTLARLAIALDVTVQTLMVGVTNEDLL